MTLGRTALESAAHASLHAPSVFNTQPWMWRLTGDTLELFADPSRRLQSTDRDGRMLLLSCGAALHHARTALNAAGWTATVERLPTHSEPELLARIRIHGYVLPSTTRARHTWCCSATANGRSIYSEAGKRCPRCCWPPPPTDSQPHR